MYGYFKTIIRLILYMRSLVLTVTVTSKLIHVLPISLPQTCTSVLDSKPVLYCKLTPKMIWPVAPNSPIFMMFTYCYDVIVRLHYPNAQMENLNNHVCSVCAIPTLNTNA